MGIGAFVVVKTFVPYARDYYGKSNLDKVFGQSTLAQTNGKYIAIPTNTHTHTHTCTAMSRWLILIQHRPCLKLYASVDFFLHSIKTV